MTSFLFLKNLSKENMRKTKPSVYKAALLLFIITVILSILVTYLSGYDRLLVNLNNISMELQQKQELLLDPTEEFIEELAAKFEAATPKIAPFAGVLIFIVIIMTGMVNAGFEGYCLKVSRTEETKALDIMRSFEHFGKALLLVIIRFAATFVGMFFFVFPGIIAYYSFSQCFMVLYDHPEYSVFKCLKESSQIMKGRKMIFFSLQVSFIFWYLLESIVALPITSGSVVIALPVLTIYTKPFRGITYAHFYNSLVCTTTSAPEQDTTQL